MERYFWYRDQHEQSPEGEKNSIGGEMEVEVVSRKMAALWV